VYECNVCSGSSLIMAISKDVLLTVIRYMLVVLGHRKSQAKIEFERGRTVNQESV
jgi:hypothetical protein